MKPTELKAKAAHYIKLVEWSQDDGCFVGSAPPLIGPCCHGSDETKVYAELCQIVEEWIATLEADGTPLPAATADRRKYSGKFVLRVEPAMHRRLVLKALAAGESLNSYCVKTLVKAWFDVYAADSPLAELRFSEKQEFFWKDAKRVFNWCKPRFRPCLEELDDEVQDLLARANLALGGLDGLTAVLPDPTLFLYSYIRKEAVLSSQIEGTQFSL